MGGGPRASGARHLHDPRHDPACWCSWSWSLDRWGPCTRDADTEDTPEDIEEA